MEHWRNAGTALEDQRRRELRALSPEDALAASEAVLGLALTVPIAPARLANSGLTEQQEALSPAPAVNPIFAAALEVQAFCRDRGWQFCFIGAVAVQRWGDAVRGARRPAGVALCHTGRRHADDL